MSLFLLNEDELRQTINLQEAIAVIEAAFVASAEGRVNIPGKFKLQLPNVRGEVTVKGSYLKDTPFFVIKIGNSFFNNPKLNLLPNSGLIAVFEAATGYPAAILLDSGYLTNVRAGIVGALATEYLANKQAQIVAAIGTGRQIFMQLKALLAVRNISLVKIWAETPLEADSFAQQLIEDHGINVEIASSIEEAVTTSQIVITTNLVEAPMIQAGWLKPGTHITALGSSGAPRQALHTDVLQQANVIIVDNLEQCVISGQVYYALEAGAISTDNIQGQLSDLILGKISGRTHINQITVVDLTGLGWQDSVIATLALDKARFLGLGQQLELGLQQKRAGQRVQNLL